LSIGWAHEVLTIVERVSVRLSHAGIVSKRLNVESRKQISHRIAENPSFLTPKISSKFEQGHPKWGR